MYIQYFQPVANNLRTVSRITSDRREDNNERERRNECCTLIFVLLLLLFYFLLFLLLYFYYIFIIVRVIYFRIYIFLFTCVFIHCVCRVSVECKVHYGNKKLTPV